MLIYMHLAVCSSHHVRARVSLSLSLSLYFRAFFPCVSFHAFSISRFPLLKTVTGVDQVQSGKKYLFVVIIDKFFDLMKIQLNFRVKICFFLLDCILFIREVKLFQGTISRDLIVFLKNDKKSFFVIQRCGRMRANSDFMVLDTWMSP